MAETFHRQYASNLAGDKACAGMPVASASILGISNYEMKTDLRMVRTKSSEDVWYEMGRTSCWRHISRLPSLAGALLLACLFLWFTSPQKEHYLRHSGLTPFQAFVMNFENACTMPIGSGPWGIRTEKDRFICSLAQ
jgi:hypothetical protein